MNTNKTIATFELTANSKDNKPFKITINPYTVQGIAESVEGNVYKAHVVMSAGIFDILEDYEYVVKVWKDSLKHNLNRFGAYNG